MPESFTEFLSMGGYGSFIWSAFGLSAVVLIGILVQSQRFLKASDAELTLLQNEAPFDGDEA